MLGIVTPPDPSLVGYNKDQITELLGTLTKLKDAINEFKVFLFADIGSVDVDHAIPVEEQRRAVAQWHTPANSIWARV